jgi:hypothetical protein
MMIDDNCITTPEHEVRLQKALRRWRGAIDAVEDIHGHWTKNPSLNMRTGRIWHMAPSSAKGMAYTDNYHAYIEAAIGNNHYYKTVGATGPELEDGRANKRLLEKLLEVYVLGPVVCHLVADGGDLPLPD